MDSFLPTTTYQTIPQPSCEKQWVLVTGATGKIGRLVCRYFWSKGFSLIAHSHKTPSQVSFFVDPSFLPTNKQSFISYQQDLSTPEGVVDLCNQIKDKPLYCFVHGASFFVKDMLSTITLDQTQRLWCLHGQAPLFIAQIMEQQSLFFTTQGQSHIITLVDSRIHRPTPDYLSYGITKVFLGELTRYLAISLAPRIRVNGICPGFVSCDDDKLTEQQQENIIDKIPLKHRVYEDDIINTIAFLLVNQSITGQLVVVDGGMG